jgi:hypothetical protein
MKLTKTQSIVATALVATLGVIGVGTAVHSASVKNQICLSYERQMEAELDKGTKILNRFLTMQKAVDENPFAAFVLLGEINDLTSKSVSFQQDMNDLRYVYDGTCSVERVNKFKNSPEIEAKVDYLLTWSAYLRR